MATTPLFKNWMLCQLPEHDYRRPAPHFQTTDFELEDVFYEAYAPMEYAYFIEQGPVSVVSTMQDGSAIEVALIANEGMVGLPILLGIDNVPCRYFAQAAGRTLRIQAEVLQDEIDRCNVLRTLLRRYMGTFITQLMQISACNSLRPVQQRCARWLLTYDDRLHTREHPLTHSFLAKLLGVRRASVTGILNPFQQAELIYYRRGKVSVLDRDRLKAFSCECYQVVAKYYHRLLTLS